MTSKQTVPDLGYSEERESRLAMLYKLTPHQCWDEKFYSQNL